MKKIVCILIAVFYNLIAFCQLKGGFDADEYGELMKMSAKFGDSAYRMVTPSPLHSKFIKRSQIVGLDNCWDLWIMQDSIAIISIRGTTAKPESWLANFYAAMVPAKGILTLNSNYQFKYDLAKNPKAAVHTGWLICTGFLMPSVLSGIDSCYKVGIKNFIIMGHSQGGAIGYLLTSHLYNLKETGRLPFDISFKTLLSAAPKPGNLYYAYDYEFMTKNGRSYNVVNAADWVPESPFTVQTMDDLNQTNPFKNAKQMIGKQKFPQKIALKFAYNKLSKPSKKARRLNTKYLGEFVAKSIQKTLPEYETPEYFNSADYVRAGNTIVLSPDSAYYSFYPDDEKKIFVHHYHAAYLYLLAKQYQHKNYTTTGEWTLEFIKGNAIDLKSLYSKVMPSIILNEKEKTISGTNGCNRINGQFYQINDTFRLDQPLISTKMFCEGEGENLFMNTLKTVNRYQIDFEGYLLLFNSGSMVMKFRKN